MCLYLYLAKLVWVLPYLVWNDDSLKTWRFIFLWVMGLGSSQPKFELHAVQLKLEIRWSIFWLYFLFLRFTCKIKFLMAEIIVLLSNEFGFVLSPWTSFWWQVLLVLQGSQISPTMCNAYYNLVHLGRVELPGSSDKSCFRIKLGICFFDSFILRRISYPPFPLVFSFSVLIIFFYRKVSRIYW